MKTYVTDTTALMNDANLYEHVTDCVVVLPVAVIRQLDGLKNNGDQDRANAARAASRVIDQIGSMGDISVGIPLVNNVTVRTTVNYDRIDEGTGNEADDKIIGTALQIKREGENDIMILTTDRNMRTVARAYGIMAEGWGNERKRVEDWEKKEMGQRQKKFVSEEAPVNVSTWKNRLGKAVIFGILAGLLFFALKAVWHTMDTFILMVGGVMIGIGLVLKFISKKTGYDFNNKKYFNAQPGKTTLGPGAVDLNPTNSPYGIDS